jgi:hypothetical protein
MLGYHIFGKISTSIVLLINELLYFFSSEFFRDFYFINESYFPYNYGAPV